MNCPHGHGTWIIQLQRTTDLGYVVFRCTGCDRTFNERTGTPFNFLEVPTDIGFQVRFCRLRDKLSDRETAELFLLRGFAFTHETVRNWEERFTPIWADRLQTQRRGKAGKVWHVDDTYVKIKGRWCYRYRAMDQNGNLVDSRLAQQRDLAAAKTFFKQTQELAGQAPDRVVTDGHTPYPRAIAEVLGPEVKQERVSCCGGLKSNGTEMYASDISI